jgi:hypothetical protein
MKKITICWSMIFFKEIEELKLKLENMWFEVYTPVKEWTWTDYSKLNKQEQADLKQFYIDKHIEKIKKSDFILVANFEKKWLKDYIWANTFLEMAFAYILEKKIFVLWNIPEQSNTVEIEWLKPIVLNMDLEGVLKYL